MRFATKAIHAGQEPDTATGAIMTPVYLTSTYVQEAPGKHKGFDYSRTNHPTRLALERNIAALEGGKFGLAFGSGLAAESTVLQLLQPGDHVISGQDLYGGTYRLFTSVYQRFGIEFSFVDTTDLIAVERAFQQNTRQIWIETPSNPLLTITDIDAVATLAHGRDVTVVVDNTFATPYLQQPLDLGADIVVHSTTKYLGGHSDVIGGALVVDEDEALYQRLKFLQNAVGAVPGPLDCFLVLRGTKTLAVRMDQHCRNARRIAQFLNGHREVEKVCYPGLTSHPGCEIAERQMKDFGGMITVQLKGGLERNLRFVTRTRIFALAESLGGVESLIGHPVTMTHASIPDEQRQQTGLSEGMVRLSVGIEDIDDLLEDLGQAIAESK